MPLACKLTTPWAKISAWEAPACLASGPATRLLSRCAADAPPVLAMIAPRSSPSISAAAAAPVLVRRRCFFVLTLFPNFFFASYQVSALSPFLPSTVALLARRRPSPSLRLLQVALVAILASREAPLILRLLRSCLEFSLFSLCSSKKSVHTSPDRR
jgi:hypothetical protein